MSVPRGFGLNAGKVYQNVTWPQEVYLQFTVNAADTGGLGVTSVKSNGYVEYVFMHTSQTPGSVSGFTNPNPAVGFAVICFKNNFNAYLASFQGQAIAPANTSTTSVTQHSIYQITALGTATLAQWQAKGFPQGFTPAVGAVFVATATGTIGGSATVGTPGVPLAPHMTIVGNPNQLINNSNVATNAGAQLIVQFCSLSVSGTVSSATFTGSALANHTHTLNLKDGAVVDGATTRVNAGTNLLGANTGSDITVAGGGANGGIANASAGTPAGTISAQTFSNTSAYAATAPADSTVINMKFSFDRSSVSIDGL